MSRDLNFPNKLLWMDLEFTGLDFDKDKILEVALIITDFKFSELGHYHSVVYQPDKVVNRMKNAPMYKFVNGKRKQIGTVYDIAKGNGLVDRIKAEGRDEKEVEKEVCDLVDAHLNFPIILAGNSIHADRKMIDRWWPDLAKRLHYRMLDVSSFKILMQGRYNLGYKSRGNHRAQEDIRSSILELKYYLRKLRDRKLRTNTANVIST